MAIDPATGMTYQKNLLESQNSEADLAKKRAETTAKNMSVLRDLAAQATDDAGFKVLKEATFRFFGPEQAARIPDRFDPAVQQRMVLSADQLISNIEAQKGRDVTTRGQDLSAQTQQRGQDLTATTTRRGQDLTDSRERDVALQGRVAQEREAGKNRAVDIAKLPQAVSTAERALRLVDELVGGADGKTKPHPGFTQTVGAALIPGQRFVPGTDAADFQARLDEIKGGAFLQAFETLKGGGQITEMEGRKATEAITRMNASQSEREFIAAAREFQSVVRGALSRAKAKAGQPAAPGGRGVTGTWDAPSGGIKFLGFEEPNQ